MNLLANTHFSNHSRDDVSLHQQYLAQRLAFLTSILQATFTT